MKPEPLPPLLLGERQAARMLGVSPGTMFNLRKRGALPFIRIGSRVCYAVKDLELFIAKNTRRGGVDANA